MGYILYQAGASNRATPQLRLQASKVVFTTQPSGAVNGVALTGQPVVQLQDANNQPVAQAGISITVTRSSGTATLSGSVTVATDANGNATFTDLVLTGTAGTHALSASSGALTSANSASFSLTAGAATKLAMQTQPAGAVEAVAFTTQPVVRLQDQSSNNVASADIAVAVVKHSGVVGTLSGTTPVNTDASGIATFTDLAMSAAEAGVSLDFSSAGLTGVTSGTFTVGAGGAFSPYAHRPANYTVVETDYAFNEASYPTGSAPFFDVPNFDGSGWGVVGNDGLTMTRVVDATAPVSPSNVLQWTYAEGSGTPADSASFGHFYRSTSEAIQAWYVAFQIWHDANFEWNLISNKLFFFWTYPSGPAILQTRFNSAPGDFLGFIMENTPGVDSHQANTAFGQALTTAFFEDEWVNVEVQYVAGASNGQLRVWAGRMDGSDGTEGQLVLEYTNINVPGASTAQELMFSSTWGGGSGPTTRDSFRRVDHVLIAHP